MSDPDSAEQTQPGLHPTGDTVSPGARQYPFLGPRQAPGELGRFGSYRVVRLLGSGGMGLVFEAEEVALRRPVALKVLKPELAADPESRERFLREARAAAEIPSDHVVTVLSVGEAGGLPFLAMPLLFGETLQARIERPTLIDLRTALVIARDTAAGLMAAHVRGLIHRDIKPANIWVETDGLNGVFKRARIFDFGLVRRPHHETSLTSTGFIVGTPNYMSPEQAAGHEVDARADLFSLGCVMYVMLTGELPFRGKSALAVMSALANRAPDPVLAKNPTVPPAVDALVLRLLEKNPEDRVRTAAEVVAALDAAIAAFSGSAPPSLPSPVKGTPLGADTLVPGKSDTWLGTPVVPEPRIERVRRRRAVFVCCGLALIVALSAFIGWRAIQNHPAAYVAPPEPIVVGVLHSQSGTMAVSENPVIDATLLAIEEINAAGGVLGRPLKPIVVDGKSDPDEFARQAERLLTEERAVVVFGCWTSASRKAVRPVFERNAGLLFYPVQYEGLEESPRIVYLGPAPNQQLIPAVDFVIDTLKRKRIALVGSDYVFPRTAHAIIRDRVAERKAAGVDVEVVAEALVPLGSPLVVNAIARVRNANADVVINTINGTTNAAFFRELRAPKQGVPNITTLSVSITENEVRGLDPRAMTDDYLVASYFQTVDRPESRAFVQKIRAKYGSDRAASDMMAAAYSGVHLWARAATAAKSIEPPAVATAVRGLEFAGPGARIRIDPENLHAWLPVRVAKVQASGEVALVPGAGSVEPVRPMPFPPTRSRDEWNQFLRKLEMDWGGKWQAPERK